MNTFRLYRWVKFGWNLSWYACHVLLPLRTRLVANLFIHDITNKTGSTYHVATPPEEYRATARGNLHTNLVTFGRAVSEISTEILNTIRCIDCRMKKCFIAVVRMAFGELTVSAQVTQLECAHPNILQRSMGKKESVTWDQNRVWSGIWAGRLTVNCASWSMHATWQLIILTSPDQSG